MPGGIRSGRGARPPWGGASAWWALLASWLLAPAQDDEVRARQAAVAELRPLLDLREDLAVLGGDLPAGVDFTALAAWGAAPPALAHRWPRYAAPLLGLASLVTLLGWLLTWFQALGPEGAFGAFFHHWGSLPFAGVLLVQLAFAGWLHTRVQTVLRTVER